MVHIVGAGCGAEDLITVRGKRLIEEADVIIYAGSLVNPGLLKYAKEGCDIYNSALMTLEETTDVTLRACENGKTVVRLHTGDPSIYGAIGEEMREYKKHGIEFDITPGVSSFCGAAAALRTEYTLPDVSQTVILTRAEGKTPVPEKEKLVSLAAHGATMVLFLSAGLLDKAARELIEGGYKPDTPAAIVYKASWPDEKIVRCTVGTLSESARANGVTKTALVTVGNFLESEFTRSHLYDPRFDTEYRKASEYKNTSECGRANE